MASMWSQWKTEFVEYLGANAFSETMQQNALDAAYTAVCNYCGRDFEAKERYCWLRKGTEPLMLANTPIISVTQASTEQQLCMTVTNTKTAHLAVAQATLKPGPDPVLVLFTRNRVIYDDQSTLTVSLNNSVATMRAIIETPPDTGWAAEAVCESVGLALRPPNRSDALGKIVEFYGPGADTVGVSIDFATGIVCGVANGSEVFIQYTGGYADGPPDVKMVVFELASSLLRPPGQGANVQSERIGNYSYTLTNASELLQSFYAPQLSRHKRRPL